jgi:magnesium transporter
MDFHYDEPGTMPGTLTIDPEAAPSEIELIDYRADRAERVTVHTPRALMSYLDSDSISWIDLRGLGSEPVLRELGEVFQLHPLLLEDIVNVPQRPKIEEYSDQLVFIARMVLPEEGGGMSFVSEQVSFVLGRNYLLTVQEEPERDCFGRARERILQGKGLIRSQGADFLTYILIDALIDGFFPVLERYGERLEELEDEVVAHPNRRTLERVHEVKRELLALRRAIWPQRDAISTLIRDGHPLVSREVQVYLRDCYDHAVQILDIVETYRELASSLMDVYLSSVSNRMNEVMKTLTIISTIFIPLTFIAGVYGMNFHGDKSPYNMPELDWYWGYPLCLALMAILAISLVIYFWRRGWFENGGR